TKLFMRRICGALKIALIKANHGRWRTWRGDRRSFENFVIERNGLLLLSEIQFDRDLKLFFHDSRARNCFTSQRIEQQAGGRFDANDGKAYTSAECFRKSGSQSLPRLRNTCSIQYLFDMR